MSEKYKISSRTLYSFINEGNYKFPRFQRKDTWNESQYFELCLSVFQEYPIGSVIVNNDRNVFSLLDGRQRRTCMKKLFEDPDAVYKWAKKSCGFNQNSKDSYVSDKFWTKVENYLGRDLEDITSQTNPSSGSSDDETGTESTDSDLESETIDTSDAIKSSSLEVLLKYILLSHNKLLKAFDFSKSFTEKALQYYSKNSNNEFYVDAVKLSNFIRGLNKEKDPTIQKALKDRDAFIDYLQSRFDYRPNNSKASNDLIKHLNNYWPVIESAFEVYSQLDAVLGNAEVGFIELNNASITDTQNVFSKTNSGGTQLNAAELLSAKPYWNEKADPDSTMKSAIDILYKKLKTDITENGVKQYCRWDIPATIIGVVDPKKLFFRSENNNESKEEVNVLEIAMGFKLVSSCFVGGMSKISLDNLEKDKNALNWSDNLCGFINSMKTMLEAIYNNTHFNVLPTWDVSLYDILGAGAAMELIATAWKKWKDGICDKPFTSVDFINFKNEFKNHFDRLIIEKMSGAYKGSGDSKMASNLLIPKERTKPLTTEESDKLTTIIDDACNGLLNGKPFKHDAMRPILYYEKVILNESAASSDTGKGFDIDHIYPRFVFETSSVLLSGLNENALCNLSLLPSETNKRKLNKTLNDSRLDTNTKNKITLYERIPETDFDKYSKPENYTNLADINKARLKDSFSNKRSLYLG